MFESVIDISKHLENLDRPLSVEEMCAFLRGQGLTPYYFVNLAVLERSVKDNEIAAEKWLEYAGQFRGKFFTSIREDAAFAVNLDMAAAFIAAYPHIIKPRRKA